MATDDIENLEREYKILVKSVEIAQAEVSRFNWQLVAAMRLNYARRNPDVAEMEVERLVSKRVRTLVDEARKEAK